MNFRVADIQACYELWKGRGAEFITPPIPRYGEIRCYIRDLDGYIIEVGQSTDLTYGRCISSGRYFRLAGDPTRTREQRSLRIERYLFARTDRDLFARTNRANSQPAITKRGA